MKNRLLTLLGGVGIAVVTAIVPSAAQASTAIGHWTLDAPSTTITTIADVYSAQVQQPINPGGTSVWPAKRGVVPVQFKVTQATRTTKTTSYTFESLEGFPWPDQRSYSDVAFTPDSAMTVADLGSLSAKYTFTVGDNHGGSLRWSIGTALGTIYVYYGDEPNFTGNPVQSGVNMIADPTDVRVDTSHLASGGQFYDTWAHAVELAGSADVSYVALVVDSGWGGDQVLTVSSVEVNGNVNVSPTADAVDETSTTPVATNAPAAVLHLVKTTGTVSSSVDETLVTSAQGDTGGHFRQVDGKYIYNLDVSGLGAGKYQAFIQIDGKDVDSAGVFALK